MKKKIFLVILILLTGGGVSYVLRPQCSLIADEAIPHFGVPIEERDDRDFYLKVFQQKEDGHWYQCKTAFTRGDLF